MTAVVLAGLPLVVDRALLPLEVGLGLAAIVAALEALIFAPLLLPLAAALLATELVVSVHRGELALWSVPLLAAGLLLFYEAGELRHRLPPDGVIESGPLRSLAVRLALTAALGLLAAVTVLAAASLSSRGGAAAAVIGGLALAAAFLLVRMLAANGASPGALMEAEPGES